MIRAGGGGGHRVSVPTLSPSSLTPARILLCQPTRRTALSSRPALTVSWDSSPTRAGPSRPKPADREGVHRLMDRASCAPRRVARIPPCRERPHRYSRLPLVHELSRRDQKQRRRLSRPAPSLAPEGTAAPDHRHAREPTDSHRCPRISQRPIAGRIAKACSAAHRHARIQQPGGSQ